MSTAVAEKVGKTLGDLLVKRIEEGKLTLPAMPGVALEAMKILKRKDAALADVVPVVEKDPLLVAEILRNVNSALNAATKKITSVERAVSRLGGKKLNSAIMQLSTRKIFQSRNQKIADIFQDIWSHSLAVAIVARDVSALHDYEDPEVAYLSGLLHDVGKPIVANMLLEAEQALGISSKKGWLESEEWLETVQKIHRKVGVALAEKWELHDSVVKTIKDCGDYDPTNRQSAGNYVRFANALVKAQGIYAGVATPEESEVLVLVGHSLLGLNEEVTTRITEGLKERVSSQLS